MEQQQQQLYNNNSKSSGSNSSNTVCAPAAKTHRMKMLQGMCVLCLCAPVPLPLLVCLLLPLTIAVAAFLANARSLALVWLVLFFATVFSIQFCTQARKEWETFYRQKNSLISMLIQDNIIQHDDNNPNFIPKNPSLL